MVRGWLAVVLVVAACGGDAGVPDAARIDARMHDAPLGTDATGGPADIAAVDGDHEITELALGSTTVGSAVQGTVEIANIGGDLTGTLALAISGSGSAEFVVDEASTCVDHALIAGANCTVIIDFTPAGSGARAAELAVKATPGGTAKVALSGNGVGSGSG
jgi:hypothetical protein